MLTDLLLGMLERAAFVAVMRGNRAPNVANVGNYLALDTIRSARERATANN